MLMANRPSDAPILIIEDNPTDAEICKAIMEKAGLPNAVHICTSGEEALDYLFHLNRYEDPESSPRPAMIALDLRLPGKSGLDVLETIKLDDNLVDIPVVVITSSELDVDRRNCMDFGAEGFIQKPLNVEKLLDTLAQFQ